MKTAHWLIAIAAILSTNSAYAKDGTLDPSFSYYSGYWTQDQAPGSDDGINGLAVTSKGQIYVAGTSKTDTGDRIVIRRLHGNGAMDELFDGGAWQPEGISSMRLADLLLQSDDKPVIVARGSNESNGVALLCRFNQDGSLDKSFAVFDLQNRGCLQLMQNSAWKDVPELLVQSDGKLVMTVHTEVDKVGKGVVVRTGKDGVPDAWFGDDGGVILSPPDDEAYTDTELVGLAEAPGGGIVAIGGPQYTSNDDSMPFHVFKLKADGSRDESFGTSGFLSVLVPAGTEDKKQATFASAVRVISDGRILIAATAYSDTKICPVVLRMMPNGSLDASFGHSGIHYEECTGERALQAMMVQPDGKILLAGSNYKATETPFVIRLLPQGMRDTGFAEDGEYSSPIGILEPHQQFTRIVAQGGRYLLGGRSTKLDGGDEDDFLLARLAGSALFADGFE